MALAPQLTTPEQLGLYGKAFAGAVVAGLGAYSSALQDGSGITAGEWIAIALSFLASFGIIWAIPMTPKVVATYGKALSAGLAALGSALITGYTDGSLSQPEVLTAVIAFALASGLTGTVSNAAASDPVNANGALVGIPTALKETLVDAHYATDANQG